jgi:hypothetical protein
MPSLYLDRLLRAAMTRRRLDTFALKALVKATHLLGLALAERLRQYRDSGDPVLDRFAQLHEQTLHVALLEEVLEILASRWDKIPDRERPHYSPEARYRILRFKTLLALPTPEVAPRFRVAAGTILRWEQEAPRLPKDVDAIVRVGDRDSTCDLLDASPDWVICEACLLHAVLQHALELVLSVPLVRPGIGSMDLLCEVSIWINGNLVGVRRPKGCRPSRLPRLRAGTHDETMAEVAVEGQRFVYAELLHQRETQAVHGAVLLVGVLFEVGEAGGLFLGRRAMEPCELSVVEELAGFTARAWPTS